MIQTRSHVATSNGETSRMNDRADFEASFVAALFNVVSMFSGSNFSSALKASRTALSGGLFCAGKVLGNALADRNRNRQ